MRPGTRSAGEHDIMLHIPDLIVAVGESGGFCSVAVRLSVDCALLGGRDHAYSPIHELFYRTQYTHDR
jgi:hypothetical protein